LLLDPELGVTGSFLTDVQLPDGTRQTNYGPSDPGAMLSTMIGIGGTGCGFEQPLHAMQRALENSANTGFLRPDAVLAIVFVTDEDDCSIRDPALFANDTSLDPLTSFRCTRSGVTCDDGGQTPEDMSEIGVKGTCTASTDPGSLLQGVQLFYDSLIVLKGDPSRIAVSAVMADPASVEVELREPHAGASPVPALAPSCTKLRVEGPPLTGAPGVRLQTFLDLFPDHSSTGSICDDSFSSALEDTATLIAQVAGSQCLTKPILDVDPATPGSQVDCVVEEVVGTDVKELAECSAVATPGCWRLVRDPEACPGVEQLRLDVFHEQEVAVDVTRARCRIR